MPFNKMLRWRRLLGIFALLRPFKKLTNVRNLQGYFLENVVALSLHVDTTIGTKCHFVENSTYSWMRSQMARGQESGSNTPQVSVKQLVSALDCQFKGWCFDPTQGWHFSDCSDVNRPFLTCSDLPCDFGLLRVNRTKCLCGAIG